jgi:hypothetical protein
LRIEEDPFIIATINWMRRKVGGVKINKASAIADGPEAQVPPLGLAKSGRPAVGMTSRWVEDGEERTATALG